MRRRDFLHLALAGAASATSSLAGCATASRSSQPRPNILFIVADDMGPWAWGYGGHPDARTPNLDRLREGGANLTNYFVTSPVCNPARASLFTSRYPSELGIIDYLSPSLDPSIGLDPNLPTFPGLLDQAGYESAFFGKWHVGKAEPHLPQQFGYDVFKGWRQGAEISKDPLVEIDGVERRVEGYSPDIITGYAIDYLRENRAKPFLLSLHFFAPHANTENRSPDGDRTWLPLSDADWEPFKDLEPTFPQPQHPKLDIPRATRMTREYLASVHAVDRNVGKVLDTLEEQGLADNTIVVFTSDHGFNMAHHGIWHKANGRWLLVDNQGNRPNLWDTTMRAPAIIRWPARIRAGSTVDHTTSNLDWFPTLMAMCGLPIPSFAVVRGNDIEPLLLGESPEWNDDFFGQYQQWPSRGTDVNMRVYRTPEWKLIRDFTRTGVDELYHLAADPDEWENLIASTDSGVVRQRDILDLQLHEAMQRIGDHGS
jgi:uncharacterized sulfatase